MSGRITYSHRYDSDGDAEHVALVELDAEEMRAIARRLDADDEGRRNLSVAADHLDRLNGFEP